MVNRAGVSPDPLEQMLDAETAADHAKAGARGERILRVADQAVSLMNAEGRLPASLVDDVRIAVFRAVMDEFYGNVAIDMPTLRVRTA